MKAEVKARKKTPQESCNTPKDFFRYSDNDPMIYECYSYSNHLSKSIRKTNKHTEEDT